MAGGAELRANLGFVALAAAATAADLPAVFELLQQQPAWGDALLIHGLVAAVTLGYAGLYTALERRRSRSEAAAPGMRVGELRRARAGRIFWAWYLVFVTALFGALGSASALVAFVLYLRHRRHARPFEQWYRELFPERGQRIYERVYDELMLTVRQRNSRAQVVPFADVINYGSREQKQLAISMMSRHFEPVFAPVLKRALEDSDNSVRIQAATAITNLESRFSDRAMVLEQRIAADPAPRAQIALARHLDRYAYSGLLDSERTQRVRARAIECYRRYLDDEPDDLDARIAVGRLLLRAGEHAPARDWLLQCRERLGPHPSLDSWLLEAHYRTGRYAEVRALAHALVAGHASGAGADVLSDSTRMWATQGVHAAPSGS